MKLRNIVLAIAVAAVAGVNVYNAVSGKQAKLSDLQMENVEMLAEAESGSGLGTYACKFLRTGCRWTDRAASVCYIWAC